MYYDVRNAEHLNTLETPFCLHDRKIEIWVTRGHLGEYLEHIFRNKVIYNNSRQKRDTLKITILLYDIYNI